jgi:hypothetical protein
VPISHPVAITIELDGQVNELSFASNAILRSVKNQATVIWGQAVKFKGRMKLQCPVISLPIEDGFGGSSDFSGNTRQLGETGGYG